MDGKSNKEKIKRKNDTLLSTKYLTLDKIPTGFESLGRSSSI